LKRLISIKGGMKLKVTLTILVVASTVLLSGIVVIYFMGLSLLHDIVGEQYIQSAQHLGYVMLENLKGELEDTKVYTKLPLLVDAVKEANLKYKDMGNKDIVPYLESMDKKWIPAQTSDPLLREYLNNRVSIELANIAKTRSGVAEIFITDKYGGIVSASEKTSDFYQADEEWWQKAYDNGKGDTYISNVEFDESSADWVISIAVPIKDESESVIGVCKNSLALKRLFSNIAVFSSGRTGRAFLVNEEGKVIFPRGLPYTDKQLLTKEIVNKLLSGKKRFIFTSQKLLSNERLFMAFSDIKPPVTEKSGAAWMIFIAQDASEIAMPFNKLISQLSFITGCLIIFAIPMGLLFGEIIVSPIRKLHGATEQFMAGNWDHKVNIKTGDEIGQFAVVFENMIAEIKDKQARLENFSRDLEAKVTDRTKKLSETQEATLNILEDLEDAKTTLEKSNKELKKLDQLKSDFVSTVSHELRTPLSIIKEGVSLVIDGVPGQLNEKQQKILDISKFNIDRLARIIDSLLDISKIEAGRIELKRGLVSVADIVKQVTLSFGMKAKEKGLTLKLNADNSKGRAYADPDRIAQVVTNLIGNAMKFTSSGYIEVSCEDKKDMVVCSVRDTGSGISKEDLPKIFNKFQQFGRLAGAGDKGTGLGLSIAKGIMDMHDGSISVESELQKGSCFTFALHRYTEQSLFDEFTDNAIKAAVQANSKASIIIVSSKIKDGVNMSEWQAGFHTAMADSARAVRNTLRRQDDKVISNNGDILIILVNCPGEHCVLVRQRLEQIFDKSMEEKNIKDKIDIKYGCATFPDDGKTSMELVNRARSKAGPGRA